MIYTVIIMMVIYVLVMVANIKDFMRFNHGDISAKDREVIIQIKHLDISKKSKNICIKT